MPRLNHVKKARKAKPGHGIKVGDEYWWAGFKRGRTGFRKYWKTRPRPSQLQSSEYLSDIMGIQEGIEDHGKVTTVDDAKSFADDLRSAGEEVRQLGEEQREKFDNMPEGLQQGDTGQLLEARAEACEVLADELDTAADELEQIELPEPEDDGTQDKDEVVSEAVESALGNIGWNFE